MGQQTDLELSVMRTILWFSMFKSAITVFEIWKWMITPERRYALSEVYSILEKSSWLQMKVDSQAGFYVLKGQDSPALIQDRQEKFLDAERKFKRLRRVASFFYLLPGVRAVGAVNTLAWWGTTPQSDIDLYVVTRTGTIWSSRFWLVLPFLLTGQRPEHGTEPSLSKDPFCFSFFATQETLALEELCVPRDYYMAFWVKSIVPLFDRDESFTQFRLENRWATRMLPNAHVRTPHHGHLPKRLPSLPIQWKVAEPLFRYIQRTRLPVELRELANLDSRVVVTDEMLKFHENDRRAEYRETYEELLERHL
ncbi:hypothetical protein HQ487_04410 [Candidatus Uhrbacteria bacterium]|nr:hypothetical protein [Candidatus Uhrbacteria bacterium]